jgi:hypothetical protein
MHIVQDFLGVRKHSLANVLGSMCEKGKFRKISLTNMLGSMCGKKNSGAYAYEANTIKSPCLPLIQASM